MTAIEDRLRDLRGSVNPPDLPTADEVAGRGRHRRGRRRAVGVLSVLTVLALVPLAIIRLSGDGDEGRVVSGGPQDALATVRAAVGRTATVGSYEIDVVTTMNQPVTSSCAGFVGPNLTLRRESTCVTFGPLTNRFTGHAIVNLEPYAMVSETNSSLGAITTHVNSTRVWQLGGATVGYGPGKPGLSLADYSSQVIGTLGRGPGALAMITISSRGGYLYLEEEAIASAEPAGTGTVGDVPVTYYDVTIDVTRLVDAPNLSDIQRQTIAAALPLLEESGYGGTTERIGVDDEGHVREVNATTNFDDGSSTVGHSILSNFGCAAKVHMPNEPRPPATAPPSCATTTTGPPSPTGSPSRTTSPPTNPPSTTTAPSGDSEASCGTVPYFGPAPGWETVQTGASATTANVPLGPNTRSGDAPWDTVERLEEGDVLLYAMFWPAGRGDQPPRELPLSLDDAQPGGLEGQPDDVYADRLGAQVDGWNIDLLVFYGGGDSTGVPPVPLEPRADHRAMAQGQLARLEVPPPC
jgi:hypothetical protein